MKELIGKYIHELWKSEDDDKLMFVVSDNRKKYYGTVEDVVMYEAKADCCNRVWFESINGFSSLLGFRVNKVEEKEWTKLSTDDGEVLDAGFWTLSTSHGYVDFEVRNSHNGYYGGDIVLVDPRFHYVHLLNKKWKPVTSKESL